MKIFDHGNLELYSRIQYTHAHYILTCTHTHACTYTHLRTHTRACTYTHLRTHTHLHMYNTRINIQYKITHEPLRVGWDWTHQDNLVPYCVKCCLGKTLAKPLCNCII